MKKYVISIDQGSTSTIVVVVDKMGDVLYKEQIELNLYHSKNSITQNPNEILESVNILLNRIFTKYNINPEEVSSIGITNQRETTILWDKITGKVIHNAISWQSNETIKIVNKWKKKGLNKIVKEKTGLEISTYFSASKIKFLLEKYKNKIDINNIFFGTIDTFLLYNLSIEKNHLTDITNASRTMLFNIKDKKWDNDLLKLFEIPKNILPKVVSNDYNFGHYVYNNIKIPITCMIGDQQSSLFGHQCFEIYDTKVTYGTGGFLLTNTENNIIYSKNGLLTTIAWEINNKINYALEGSIFVCGSAIKWLRDELKLINNYDETSDLAKQSTDSNIYVVPSFFGLGTPYWEPNVKGTILGISKNTNRNDIIRATLDSICYQTNDVIDVIKKDLKNENILKISTDGGSSRNEYLLQFQADISNTNILQTKEKEVTALGAAYIAGLKTSFFNNLNDIKKYNKINKIFFPSIDSKTRKQKIKNWKKAIKSTMSFKI